ncbi:MAG: UDP-glucose 4-epimerase [Candidatus Cloacimonetes bacterium HGW-Cloacimonetes-3]|jgi:UDP-glucose 4-epimerase|nr:MAG: UDP-glucose 4-epimerase [Candidatus Cloacimonetes bacterium HGW-Cloacimonetes-3]
MKVLITGAAGFIASHVADAYLKAGHEVVIIDNLVSGYQRNINPQATFYHMDICDPALEQVFAKEQPDIVNHHAAQVSVPRSISNPLYDVEVNVKGLINILECCVKYSVKKVIFISSGGAIYGEATEYPTTENYAPKPLSVYAINKMVGESYLYFYHHQYGLNYTVLRYANVYGPRQVSHGEAGVVSLFTEQMLAGVTPTIFRYPDQPEGMIRDYVYVGDVVQANLLALEHGEGQAFNIGTCTPTSTLKLYQELVRLFTSLHLPLVTSLPLFGIARQGDLRNSMLDFSKARRNLGWEPKVNLAEGLANVISYFSQLRSNA